MGEANRDNLFMSQAAKDVAYIAMRSPAWTFLGPGREIMGGARSGLYGAARLSFLAVEKGACTCSADIHDRVFVRAGFQFNDQRLFGSSLKNKLFMHQHPI